MTSSIIETPRLCLREITDGDVESLLVVFGDAEGMRFYRQPFDRAKVQEWVDWCRRCYAKSGYGLWAMVLRETDEVIGDCGLVDQEVEGAIEVEIGYHVRRDLWGHGLATEAALACRDYGFSTLEGERLISLIHPENFASRRVAEKVGMTIWKQIEWKGKPTCVYAIEKTARENAKAD